jgi:hypothetical protein
VGSPEFLQRFRRYYDLRTTRSFAPNFALITGDKDDPRFDKFYLAGNPLRLFIALFLSDMPSYMALGFETRDPHHKPAPNEHYTKLFVFQERTGPKATSGPYVWGRNGALFSAVMRLRLYADQVFPRIKGRPIQWLIYPDPTGEDQHLAWTQGDRAPDYLFVANTDTEHAIYNFDIPRIRDWDTAATLRLEFSTARRIPEIDQVLSFERPGYKVSELAPGEGRAYRILLDH